ncbi:hypothetical protein D3C72_1176190 [compost metagenome]
MPEFTEADIIITSIIVDPFIRIQCSIGFKVAVGTIVGLAVQISTHIAKCDHIGNTIYQCKTGITASPSRLFHNSLIVKITTFEAIPDSIATTFHTQTMVDGKRISHRLFQPIRIHSGRYILLPLGE